jgi:hypothetical protein
MTVSNKVKRTDDWESYMTIFTNYNKEIRMRESVKMGLIPAVEDVADRIVDNQTANSVGCIKLPDGRYTQTLVELYRVNFPGSQRGGDHGRAWDAKLGSNSS